MNVFWFTAAIAKIQAFTPLCLILFTVTFPKVCNNLHSFYSNASICKNYHLKMIQDCIKAITKKTDSAGNLSKEKSISILIYAATRYLR